MLRFWLQICFLAAIFCFAGVISAQEEEEAAEVSEESVEEPVVEEGVVPVEEKEKDAEKEKESPGDRREEMLERLADQLSKRMKSLREREEALSAREKALSEREETADERERSVGAMEEMLRMREDVIQRREKLPPPQSWNGPDAPSNYGRYTAVIDANTMQFYYKKEAHTQTPVASTQKLVTALVVCNDGNLDKMVTVPKEVYDVEPTVVGVKPGEQYTRRQLLTSLLVKSGNDIAATLAIDNAGSIEAFAEKMNTLARYIGMTNSNFVNPHGLPEEGQYSTARDIAIAAFEAYRVPDIREMVNKATYEFVFNDGSKRMLYNTNKVLNSFEGCNGMKTGFTYAAGNCLVCSASKDGQDIISVIIKSARPYVWNDSKSLLTWALELEKTPLPDEDLALAP